MIDPNKNRNEVGGVATDSGVASDISEEVAEVGIEITAEAIIGTVGEVTGDVVGGIAEVAGEAIGGILDGI
jgi:hypothetical protein